MFTIEPGVVPLVAAFGLPALLIVAVLYRPLLLSSVSPDLAAARGVRVRADRPGLPDRDRAGGVAVRR